MEKQPTYLKNGLNLIWEGYVKKTSHEYYTNAQDLRQSQNFVLQIHS